MTDNIFTQLAKVSAEVGAVGKDGFNSGQKFYFRGVDAVVNACHNAMNKHGITVVPRVLDAEYEKGTTANGKSTTIVRLKVMYVFGLSADEYVESIVVSEANDSADKATAKAMSVAFRTALLQVLLLPTDDVDPDEDYDEVVDPKAAALGELLELAKSKGIMAAVKDAAEDQFKAKVPQLDLEQIQKMIKFAENAPSQE